MKILHYIILLLAVLLVSCKQEVYYNVTTNAEPPEGGSVVMNPSAGQVLEGTSVTFSAQPKGDYVFTGWSGSVSGTENPKTVTVTSDLTVTANFALREYPLSIIVEGEGSVSERVISAKADYASGTVVELTALPATGWSFDHWEGDLTGADNPITITISSAKTVKAVFTKNHYAYNLKIVGPGVVDEYLVENTKATLEYGTKVHLKAIPAKGAIFKNWSGSLSGTDGDVVVDVDSPKEITATFEMEKRQYPKFDYKLPSVKQKCLYYGIDYSAVVSSNVNCYCPVDYNGDGYIDLVISNTDWSFDGRFPIRFVKGTNDGFFSIDQKNDRRILGLNNVRKFITGDYNGDGILDLFLIGHGYDAPPFPGEYPVALLSNLDGSYSDVRLTDVVAFYHGGASADIDNDGDLDIVLVDGGGGHEVVLLNDGAGNFTAHYELVNHELLQGFYTADLFDIDQDGFIDLITGLDDVNLGSSVVPFENDYNNMSIVFWGNGESFNHDHYTRLPKTPYQGMGLVLDYEFFDIDNDGIDEVFLLRTGDSVFGINYTGWAIQIVKYSNGGFYDVTENHLLLEDGCEREGDAIYWIDFENINGTMCLIGRRDVMPHKMFELKDGRLTKPQESPSGMIRPEDGLHIYSEGVISVGSVDYGCDESPLSGNTCIKISDWHLWTQFSIPLNSVLQNGTDLSYLRDNGFALEFYIRNTDPFIEIHFKLNSVIEEEHENDATFCYAYRGNEHVTDGSWERIVMPLKDLDEWNTIEDFMKKIDHFNVILCSEGGADFFLDEIRIRKVLPE